MSALTADASPAMKLDAATTALVVVDMQNDFCSTSGYYAKAGRDISKLAGAVAPVAALVSRARASGATIVFTRLVYDTVRGAMEDRHTIRPKRWTTSGERLKPGTWGSDVVDELKPGGGDIIIDKTGYSSFAGTTLDQQLRARGIKTVLLAGVVTYACVLATAFDAFDRDFDVVLATDAVGSWSEPLGASTSDIVDLLLGVATSATRIDFSPAGKSKAS